MGTILRKVLHRECKRGAITFDASCLSSKSFPSGGLLSCACRKKSSSSGAAASKGMPRHTAQLTTTLLHPSSMRIAPVCLHGSQPSCVYDFGLHVRAKQVDDKYSVYQFATHIYRAMYLHAHHADSPLPSNVADTPRQPSVDVDIEAGLHLDLLVHPDNPCWQSDVTVSLANTTLRTRYFVHVIRYHEVPLRKTMPR